MTILMTTTMKMKNIMMMVMAAIHALAVAQVVDVAAVARNQRDVVHLMSKVMIFSLFSIKMIATITN
jgi:hypothetical protein